MKKINLKKYYPDLYDSDLVVEVPDEVAKFLETIRIEDATFQRKTRLYERCYDFNFNPMENTVQFHMSTPVELYERKLTNEQLYKAMAFLSVKQARRVYSYYFLNKTLAQIAEIEGIAEATVWLSIQQGLKKIEQYLKNS